MESSPQESPAPPYQWRNRLWGLDPQRVEEWAEGVWQHHVRELSGVLTELKGVRGDLAASEASAREIAERADAAEARVAQLEAQQEARDQRYRELRGRVRAAIAAASARAREIEERTQRQLEQAAAQWRDEEVRLQRERERDREEWQAALEGLHDQQLRAIKGTEAFARDLLDFAGVLRARVLDRRVRERAAAAALPPLDYYWRSTSDPDPSPAPDRATGPVRDGASDTAADERGDRS